MYIYFHNFIFRRIRIRRDDGPFVVFVQRKPPKNTIRVDDDAGIFWPTPRQPPRAEHSLTVASFIIIVPLFRLVDTRWLLWPSLASASLRFVEKCVRDLKMLRMQIRWRAQLMSRECAHEYSSQLWLRCDALRVSVCVCISFLLSLSRAHYMVTMVTRQTHTEMDEKVTPDELNSHHSENTTAYKVKKK